MRARRARGMCRTSATNAMISSDPTEVRTRGEFQHAAPAGSQAAAAGMQLASLLALLGKFQELGFWQIPRLHWPVNFHGDRSCAAAGAPPNVPFEPPCGTSPMARQTLGRAAWENLGRRTWVCRERAWWLARGAFSDESRQTVRAWRNGWDQVPRRRCPRLDATSAPSSRKPACPRPAPQPHQRPGCTPFSVLTAPWTGILHRSVFQIGNASSYA